MCALADGQGHSRVGGRGRHTVWCHSRTINEIWDRTEGEDRDAVQDKTRLGRDPTADLSRTRGTRLEAALALTSKGLDAGLGRATRPIPYAARLPLRRYLPRCPRNLAAIRSGIPGGEMRDRTGRTTPRGGADQYTM